MAVSPSEKGIRFGPFFLSAEDARLLRDGTAVPLTPRAFDVLQYLADRPQRLVTKDELLSKIWSDVLVSDASIKVCINEIRKALGDGAKAPTYIETAHRRGYRFIAPVDGMTETPNRAAGPVEETTVSPTPAVAAPPPLLPESTHPFVGREAQLREMHEAFEIAASGRRQCVIVSGEPGSGKTTLVEEFARYLQRAPGGARPLFLYGHCLEQLGAGEPYMPVWEAIGRVARQTPLPQARALLERHLAAHVGGSSGVGAAERPTTPINPKSERVLREISETIESMAGDSPVVLVLEDVHWADHSTIDLISSLNARQTPARLLMVLTHRPGEIAAKSDHPLRAVFGRMLTTGRCREILLDDLDERAVAEFVARRCPGVEFPTEFSRRLHQRTGGSPLFLVQLVDDLIDQGVLYEEEGAWRLLGQSDGYRDEREGGGWVTVLDRHVPQNLRAMIDSHVERLNPALRRFLEAAAVAGVTFSALAVAAAGETDVVRAEDACEELSRGHRFLDQSGHDEWPDGTIGTHYTFTHSLYHNVVYGQIPIARRIRMHQLIGQRIESAWADRSAEESATLAMHFEAARDWPRAVRYLRSAAQIAGRQYAYPEAEYYLRRALACVERLPAPERDEHELEVLSALSVNLQVTRGFAAPEVEALYARAYALCVERRDIADVEKNFPVLWGIWLFHKVRSDLDQASDMCKELLSLARGNSSLQLQAHQAMCVTNLCRGEPEVTCAHMELAATIYDPVKHRANAERFGQDPGVATLAFGSVALWILGRTQDASHASERSLALAIQLAQPSSQALAMHFAAMLHQLRGDVDKTAHWAQHAIDLAEVEGFSFWHAGGRVLRGWASAVRAGEADDKDQAAAATEEMRRGLEAWLETGSRTYHTYYLGLLADALQQTGRAAESLEPLTEAIKLTRALGEGLYEAELYRLHGRAIVLSSPDDACPFDARTSFIQATAVARIQNARAFEDRASTDLAILLGRQMQRNSDPPAAAFKSSYLRPPPRPEGGAGGIKPIISRV